MNERNKGNGFCDRLFSLDNRLWDLFSFHEIFVICRTGCARLFLKSVSEVPPLRGAGFLDFVLIGFSSLLKQDQWSLFHKPTREHSSGMRAARLPTVCASVVATRCQSVLGGGGCIVRSSEKFEQVSSDGHQMSLGGGRGEGVSTSHVRGRGAGQGVPVH